MIPKGCVLAENVWQYQHFIKNFNLNHKDFPLISNLRRTHGFSFETTVFLLEGYQNNHHYSLHDAMFYLGRLEKTVEHIPKALLYKGR